MGKLCACGCGLPVTNKWRQGHNPKIKGRPFTEEHRERIRSALKGKYVGENHPKWRRPVSEETRRKIGDAHRGKTVSAEARRKISETKLAQGASTAPVAIHLWLRRHYPKAGICDRCGAAGKTDFASINGHIYTRNREDYAELCPSCHLKHDYAEGRR